MPEFRKFFEYRVRMASVDRFSTSRLHGHRLDLDDFAVLHGMHRDQKVMRTLGGTRSEEGTHDYVRRNLEHWKCYGYGLWILRTRDDGSFVGRSALRHVELNGNNEIEVGYALMQQYWGRGLATEVTLELVKLAFTGLGIPNLVAFTLPDNVASRRVMEKAGGAYEGDIIHANQPHVLYRFRPSNSVSLC